MTGKQRREQLLDIGRELFAERGFEGTSIEEIAARADVSKPVVYEHFGGKEGLYAVVVDREMQTPARPLHLRADRRAARARCSSGPRWRCWTTSRSDTDGFRVLVRDSPVDQRPAALRQR